MTTYNEDVEINGSLDVLGTQDETQLEVQGVASQNAPLQTWEDSDANVLVQVDADGQVLIDGQQDQVQLRVQAHSAQTEPLQTWEKSDGTPFAQVTGDGRLELGDLDLGTPDGLVEVNRDITLSSSVPQRGIQSRGLIRGAISNAIAWAVHELELLGDGGVSGLHAALRAKISQKNTGDASQTELRAGDFEAINEQGSSGTPVGKLVGVQSTITNEESAYLDKAVGIGVKLNDENSPSQTQYAYGLLIEDVNHGAQANFAIHTGKGIVHVGDHVEMAPLDTEDIPSNPATGVLIYSKQADNKLYARTPSGEYELGGGGGAGQLSDLTDVNSSAPTDGNILRGDGVDWESVPGEAHFVPKQPTSDILIDSDQHDFGISGRLCTLLDLDTTNDAVWVGGRIGPWDPGAHLQVMGAQQIYNDGTDVPQLDINVNNADPVLRLTGHDEGSLMPRIETQIGRGQRAQPDLVEDQDPLLLISAGGYGGSAYEYSQATWIISEVDGDVGPYVPGRLRFLTSDGSDALPAGGQMVLDSQGRVGINIENPTAQLQVESSDAARVAFVARAESGQTANVREIQNSNGILLEGTDKDGATVQKAQSSTPATPSSGYHKLYPKSDGWYDLNSAGQEAKIGSGAPEHYRSRPSIIRRVNNSRIAVLHGVAEVNDTEVAVDHTALDMATGNDWLEGSSQEAANQMVYIYLSASGDLKLSNRAPIYPRADQNSIAFTALVNQSGWDGTADNGLDATSAIYDGDSGEANLEPGMWLGICTGGDTDYSDWRGAGSGCSGGKSAPGQYAFVEDINTSTNTLTLHAGHNIAINDNDRLFAISGVPQYRYEGSVWYRCIGTLWNDGNQNLADDHTGNAQTIVRNNDGQYSTNSTTFVPMDSTNLKCTLKTNGGNVLVNFVGFFRDPSGGNAGLDVRVDGYGQEAAIFSWGLMRADPSVTTLTYLIIDLPAGIHTFEILWRTSGVTWYCLSDTDDSTDRYNVPVIFTAQEVY